MINTNHRKTLSGIQRTDLPESVPDESTLRRDLAAAYRLAAMFGWDDTIYTHFSVRLPKKNVADEERFLINPFGLLFEEIKASDLIVVDAHGDILEGQADYNLAGFTIHSAVHTGREDAACVLHTHTLAGMALAACPQGLMQVNQINTEFYGRLGSHDYEGVSVDLGERERLQTALGKEYVGLILRNHGLLTVGASVADAFYLMFYLNRAAEIQLASMQMGSAYGGPRVIAAALSERACGQLQQIEGDRAVLWNAWLRKLDRMDSSYRD